MTRPGHAPPARSAFTRAERAVIDRLRTPLQVQRYLNRLRYNTERGGETLRSFRGVVAHRTAHCLEAALFAATVLEQHGYPPLVLSFESIDLLDHVIFVYQHQGRWGSVARSRDPGLHGRRPVFANARALARSYMEPYIDHTGGIRAYGVADLRVLGRYDWRLSSKNVWKVEQMLIDHPHRKVSLPLARERMLRRWYKAFRTANDDIKPVDYADRHRWTELPIECLVADGRLPRRPR